MKTNNRNRFVKGLLVLMLTCLPVLAHALAVVEIDPAQVDGWAATEAVVTVPSGTAYKLQLADGDAVVLGADTVFMVKREDGEPEQIIILSGKAVLDRAGAGGGLVQFVADGNVIESAGAGLVLSVEGGAASISQLGDSGTVSVGGRPIPAGSGGTISGEGLFRPSAAVGAQLSSSALQILRDAAGPPAGRPDPQGRPPYERLKPLPEKIVRENLNDVSPS